MGFFENLLRYFFPKQEGAAASQRSSSPERSKSNAVRSMDLDSFSYEADIYTDTATFALFDEQALVHRGDEEHLEWWMFEYHKTPEIKNGVLVLVSTHMDGVFRIRLTNQDLTDDEKHFVKWVVPEMGVQVVSGQIYLSGAESMPQGYGPYSVFLEGTYSAFSLKNGDYTVRSYGLDLDDLDDQFTPEEKQIAEKLPNIVMQILPGKAKIPRMKDEPDVYGFDDAKYVMRAKTTKTAPKRESVEVTEGTGLAGKTVVFTGKLTKFTRKEAEAAAKKQGASVGSSVTEKTSLLVIGEAPGSKATKARELGVEIITEDQWLELIGK